MAFAILAWADCIFSLQGNSQDLHTGSGIRRHASIIINARRGTEERYKKTKHVQEHQKSNNAVLRSSHNVHLRVLQQGR